MRKNILFIVLLFSMLSGCSTNMGRMYTKSHFTYPNSNVIPLGNVKAEETNFSILLYPSFDKEDQLALLNKAISQKSGADLLINYNMNVKLTVIPIPILSPAFLTVSIEGMAASMEIGEQELLDVVESIKYR